MKGKSLLLNIFTIAISVLGVAAGLFTPAVASWIGLVSFALTIVLNTVFPSGVFVSGWNIAMWITNLGGIVLQLINYAGAHALVDPQTVNYVVVAVNVLIQVLAKDFGSGTIVGGTTPATA